MERAARCEEQVLVIVWESEEAPDLHSVMDRVNSRFHHDWKPQTVSTFLMRLTKKGFLESYRKGRYTYYIPKVSRDEYKCAAVVEMEALFGKLS